MAKFVVPENMIVKHHKYRIYPTTEQAKFIDRCIELSRFVFNWAVEQEQIQYSMYQFELTDKQFLTRFDLERRFTELRNSEGYEFLKEIPHISARMAIANMEKAYDKFFKGINSAPPGFKSRKYSKQSYTTRYDRMYFSKDKLRIEGLARGEFIKTDYHVDTILQKEGPMYYNPVITKDYLDEYWITFDTLEPRRLAFFDDNHIAPLNRALGIDLNVKRRYVLSDGTIFMAPNLEPTIEKIKRLQRKVQKDRDRLNQKRTNSDLEAEDCVLSKRATKRIYKLRKAYKRLKDINHTYIHTVTMQIIRKHPSAIVMENLDNIEMRKQNKAISKHIAHANFYKSREIMQYKAYEYGIPFLLADKTFPSTQKCSCCGAQHPMGSRRIYRCPVCGLVLDRDINSAINLENLAYEQLDIQNPNELESVA